MSIASRIESMTEHLTNDWGIIDSLGLHTNKLPKEYTQVDYIQSSGTQYIDTGVKAKGLTTNIETKYKLNRLTDYNFIFSVRNDNTTRFDSGWGSNGKIWFAYTTGDIIAINGNTTDIITFKKDDKKIYFNNELVITMDNLTDFTTTNNITLFANNNNGTINNYASLKMYYCKLYDNGTLVRDFIPCYRNTDNEVGLYDLVNNVFYTNQGTGSFTYGEIQEEHIDRNLENLSLPLKDLYNEVSNKTDLSQNGVVGRTSQETTTGKNLFDINTISSFNQNLATLNNGLITTINLSQDTTSNIIPVFTSINLPSDTYYLSMDIRRKSGSGNFSKINDGAVNYEEVSKPTLSSTFQRYVYKHTYDNSKNLNILLIQFSSSTNAVYEIKNIMISTSNNATYEEYTGGQPSPNPDYPQPINNLTGDVSYEVSGKNKFNINKTPSIIQYNTYSITNNKITFTNTATTSNPFSGIEIPIKLKNNTQYTISFKVGKNSSSSSMERTIYIVKKQATNNFGTSPEFLCSGLSANTSSENKKLTFTTTQEDYFIRLYAGTNTESIANPNYYENIQIEEGSTGTSYEPYIEPQTFNIPLKSKNLFDKDNITNGKYIKPDGTIGTDATAFYSNYIKIEPNTNYYISGRTIWNSIGLYDSNKTFLERINLNYTSGIINITNNNCAYIIVNASIDNLNSMQLEKGNQATTYEPYYDIELCKIDTYEDKIYSSDGRFYLNKKIGKVILNGSEEWVNIATNNETTMLFQQKNASDFVSQIATNNNLFKTNKFRIYNCFGNANTSEGSCHHQDRKIMIRIFRNRLSTEDVSGFTTWITNNNVTCYGQLRTPTTTEITQENYPALYNALKQIQDYLTAYKINKEFILGYSSPKIEY